AARLRDTEKRLLEELDKAKAEWESEAKLRRFTVDEQHIAEVVAMMSGVPVTRIAQAESEKLSTMGDTLKSRVIGQNKAVDAIAKAIQRTRAGLKDPKKPIGSF